MTDTRFPVCSEPELYTILVDWLVIHITCMCHTQEVLTRVYIFHKKLNI